MTSTRMRRLTAQVIQADIDAYLALKVIPDYQPFNPDYSLNRVSELHEQLLTTLEAELHAQHALLAARDAAVAAQSAFHDVILGVKNQVKAQYGVDSDQLVSVGLKKKSERKAATRNPKPATRPEVPAT